jgi:hypothetical protein
MCSRQEQRLTYFEPKFRSGIELTDSVTLVKLLKLSGLQCTHLEERYHSTYLLGSLGMVSGLSRAGVQPSGMVLAYMCEALGSK